MKASYILMVLIFCSAITKAQEYNYVYYLDKNFASVDSVSALFIGEGYNDAGLFAIDAFDKTTRKLFLTAHFVDSTLGDLQGRFTTFYPDGTVQSEGDYKHSKQDGIWINLNSSGLKTDSIVFDKGMQISNSEFGYYTNLNIKTYSFTEPAIDHYIFISYDDKGNKVFQTESIKDSGTITTYTNAVPQIKPLNSGKKKEAEFPGGIAAFRKYIEKNINMRTALMPSAPPGQYVTVIAFTINKDGSVTDVIPESREGYGIEQEAVRVIKGSPSWIPAKQGGIPVRSSRRQPIAFAFTSDGLFRYFIN